MLARWRSNTALSAVLSLGPGPCSWLAGQLGRLLAGAMQPPGLVLVLALSSLGVFCRPPGSCTAAAHAGDNEAERRVFSTASASALLEDESGTADAVRDLGQTLSAVLTHEAVEATLRRAELLEPVDRWFKPIKPVLLQEWWDGRGNGQGLAEPDTSDPLKLLVRLFVLRRTVLRPVLQAALGSASLTTLIQLGVLYPTGPAEQLASAVQLFPLRRPLPDSVSADDGHFVFHIKWPPFFLVSITTRCILGGFG